MDAKYCSVKKDERTEGKRNDRTRRVRVTVRGYVQASKREGKKTTDEGRRGGSLAEFGPCLDEFSCFTAGVMINSSTKLVSSH